MSDSSNREGHSRENLSHVAVIIPALNEAKSLTQLLPQLARLHSWRSGSDDSRNIPYGPEPRAEWNPDLSGARAASGEPIDARNTKDETVLARMGLGDVLVCDNGSTDTTRAVTEAHGAQWVYEPKRGYGSACWAGMERLPPDIEVVVFLDADLSDDPTLLPDLAAPILRDECDFVVSTRVASLRQRGAMTLPQRVANVLFPVLIRWGWGFPYTDMGPFRAIRKSSLDRIGMKDRAFGWTIEMQIRAVELGLRIRELPVPYRKREGRSKISGTVRGAMLAAYWIIRTCAGLWFTKRKRRASFKTGS